MSDDRMATWRAQPVTRGDLKDMLEDLREERRAQRSRDYRNLAELLLIHVVILLVQTAVIVGAVWYFR